MAETMRTNIYNGAIIEMIKLIRIESDLSDIGENTHDLNELYYNLFLLMEEVV